MCDGGGDAFAGTALPAVGDVILLRRFTVSRRFDSDVVTSCFTSSIAMDRDLGALSVEQSRAEVRERCPLYEVEVSHFRPLYAVKKGTNNTNYQWEAVAEKVGAP